MSFTGKFYQACKYTTLIHWLYTWQLETENGGSNRHVSSYQWVSIKAIDSATIIDIEQFPKQIKL